MILGLLGVGMLLVIAGVTAAGRRDTERREARLAAIDRKLDAILAHLGIEHEQPELRHVEELLSRGKTIAAVTACREATGAGLKEAKDEVDRLRGRA